MNTFSLSMALLMGFTGSLHCAGMCGPIVWVMPFQGFGGLKKALAIAGYHLGRITVYALLGLILFSFKSVFNPHIQQYISLGLGGLLLLLGVISFIPGKTISGNMPWANWVRQSLGKVMSNPGVGTMAVAGMLNGLLPCGLVYMALSASLAANDTAQVMAFMYVFGLGTAPMLIALTVLRSRMTFLQRFQIRKLVPVFMFAFGGLFLLRGMNLGIPYLSPKVMVEAGQVKACCCHKK